MDSHKKSHKKVDLATKEEEYKLLNQKLEAQTASLVQEADAVLNKGESYLLPDSFSHSDLFTDTFPTSESFDLAVNNSIEEFEKQKDSTKEKNEYNKSIEAGLPPHQRLPSAKSSKSVFKSKTRPSSGKSGTKITNRDNSIEEKASLRGTIANIESRLESIDLSGVTEETDNILPSPAADIGQDAQIRFFKAKLHVMQEELDRLSEECSKKEEANSDLIKKLKNADEEKLKLSRSNASQLSQAEKYKKSAEDAKHKVESLNAEITALKRELETLKRGQKQLSTNQNSTEVRLNRALEDVDKYKTQLQHFKTQSKETSVASRGEIEQLTAENRQLLKQKEHLIVGFKKQLKLIDVLKRQKMHIEAAKMLSFTEEEFAKALEWDS